MTTLVNPPLTQSLQQDPSNRAEIEQQLQHIKGEIINLHRYNINIYIDSILVNTVQSTSLLLTYINHESNPKRGYNLRSRNTSATCGAYTDPPNMDSELMDLMGLPQTGTWTKQFIDSGDLHLIVLFY